MNKQLLLLTLLTTQIISASEFMDQLPHAAAGALSALGSPCKNVESDIIDYIQLHYINAQWTIAALTSVLGLTPDDHIVVLEARQGPTKINDTFVEGDNIIVLKGDPNFVKKLKYFIQKIDTERWT